MNSQVLHFLKTLDEELARDAAEEETLDQYLLGRAALMVHLSLTLSTKDVDIVNLNDNTPLEKKAKELFARDSQQARNLGLYLDHVPQGLPPLPHWFRIRSQEIPGTWKVIHPKVLEIHDLAATKLKSFRAKDRQDLQTRCDRGLLDPDRLRESLAAAFCWTHEKDDDPGRDAAFANLEMVLQYLQGKIPRI